MPLRIEREGGVSVCRRVRAANGSAFLTDPDDNETGRTTRPATWIGPESCGTIWFEDCHIEEHNSHAIYAAAAPGPIKILRGVYRNNDNSGIRFCGPDCEIDGALIELDTGKCAHAPHEAYRNTRGIFNEQKKPPANRWSRSRYDDPGSKAPEAGQRVRRLRQRRRHDDCGLCIRDRRGLSGDHRKRPGRTLGPPAGTRTPGNSGSGFENRRRGPGRDGSQDRGPARITRRELLYRRLWRASWRRDRPGLRARNDVRPRCDGCGRRRRRRGDPQGFVYRLLRGAVAVEYRPIR